MPDKDKLDGNETKSPTDAAPSAAINISIPQNKADGGTKAWLQPIGTLLSGFAATMAAVKAPRAPALPPPAPNPIVDDAHVKPLFPLSQKHAIGMESHFTGVTEGQPYSGYGLQYGHLQAKSSLEPIVNSFGAFPEHRKQFIEQFRHIESHAVAAGATSGEEAISTLLDEDESTEHRVAAAFYLGGHGKREYISPLKVASQQYDIVGRAAQIALDMIAEHLNRLADNQLRGPSPPTISLTQK